MYYTVNTLSDCKLILNGDDPYLQYFTLNVKNECFYFGIDKTKYSYTKNDYSFTFSSMKYPIEINSFPVIKTIEMPNLYVYVKYQYKYT